MRMAAVTTTAAVVFISIRLTVQKNDSTEFLSELVIKVIKRNGALSEVGGCCCLLLRSIIEATIHEQT